MAPSGKNKHIKVPKPSGDYVHPSLQSASKSSSATEGKQSSVSERIEFLRRAQARRAPMQNPEEQSTSTSCGDTLQRSRRQPRVAGPKPPKSWTEKPSTYKLASATKYSFSRDVSRLDYFPGVEFPPQSSLLHQGLKSLAAGFDWHAEFDGVYLASLPVKYKNLLLSYIARYGPEDGIFADDLLQVLYSEEELEELLEYSEENFTLFASGCEELTRLDLGGSIGRRMNFKQLEKCWHIGAGSEQPAIPESWEEAAAVSASGNHQSAPSIPPPMRLRFPSLTKLSLAHPGQDVSWPEFLHFSRHLRALTHLSLAHWPTPRFSTATFPRFLKNPIQLPQYGVPTYQKPDQETRDNAVEALRLLSRNTPSLTYLSLAGCETWLRVLMHIPPPIDLGGGPRIPTHIAHTERRHDQAFEHTAPDNSNTPPRRRRTTCPAVAGKGIDWDTNWQHLKTLDVRQSRLPKTLPAFALAELYTERTPRTIRLGAGSQDVASSLPGHCYYSTSCRDVVHVAAQRARGIRTQRFGAVELALEHSELQATSEDTRVLRALRWRVEDRVWVARELDALEVRYFLRQLCALVGLEDESKAGRHIEVLHGWDKETLVGVGYSEQDLFEAGF